MQEPTFAVIMPLYNKAPYVRRAVKSVVAQTCGDWQLWVVDDGSTDGSAKVLSDIADPRIHLHRQSNAGVAAARNRGVALSAEAPLNEAGRIEGQQSEGLPSEKQPSKELPSKGLLSGAAFRSPVPPPPPFLCFLDADDWWEPTFLEEMAALIGRHPGAGIYATSYTIVNRHKHKTRPAPIGVPDGFAEGEIDYCAVYARTLGMPLWTGAVCMPRAVFEEQGGFPDGIRLGEDFLLWVRVALRHRVVLLNKPLANYNQDSDPQWRGTGHLHPPQHHMLFHLAPLQAEEQRNAAYKRLVDRLRVDALMPYLLDRRYRRAARAELAKVDWHRQPRRTRLLYRLPVWALRLQQKTLRLGACLKQTLRQCKS